MNMRRRTKNAPIRSGPILARDAQRWDAWHDPALQRVQTRAPRAQRKAGCTHGSSRRQGRDRHWIVPFRMCRAVAPHMREPAKQEKEAGREVFRKIVNVTSISGTMGNAGQANYSSGKAAVTGLTKTLAKEWGQFKINVNAVAFGYIETRLTASKDQATVAETAAANEQPGIPNQLRGM